MYVKCCLCAYRTRNIVTSTTANATITMIALKCAITKNAAMSRYALQHSNMQFYSTRGQPRVGVCRSCSTSAVLKSSCLECTWITRVLCSSRIGMFVKIGWELGATFVSMTCRMTPSSDPETSSLSSTRSVCTYLSAFPMTS